MAGNFPAATRVCSNCHKTYSSQEAHVCAAGAASSASHPAPQDAHIGTVLGGRYRIESFIQRGGMGTVYLARHTVLDKPIAVKILNEAKDKTALQRFLLEAKSACQINHEHIVDITDYGVLDDGRPYLVMEFLQGQPLDVVIAKGPLSPLRVCRIGEQIAQGLQAVHDKGILHRDLKPGNVFLLERHRKDYVKILDFGIAKVVADPQQPPAAAPGTGAYRPTQEGTVLGTPEYLAPEQALGEPLDHRVDQYALGCILYEMLTGDVPFKGNTAMGTVVKRLSERPVPVRQRRPDLPIAPSLEAVTMRALSRERELRFPSMNDLAQALSLEYELLAGQAGDQSGSTSMSLVAPLVQARGAAQSLSGANPPFSQAAQVSAAQVPAAQRRRMGIWIGAAVALLCAGVAALLVPASPQGKNFTPSPSDVRGAPVARTTAGSAGPSGASELGGKARLGQSGSDTRAQDTGAAAQGTEGKDRSATQSSGESKLLLTFENGTSTTVTVTCQHQRPCTMAAQKLCQFKISTEQVKCEASAPGYRPRVFSYRDLRSKGRGGRIKESVVLDAKGLGELKL